jgi:hypothetical protein
VSQPRRLSVRSGLHRGYGADTRILLDKLRLIRNPIECSSAEVCFNKWTCLSWRFWLAECQPGTWGTTTATQCTACPANTVNPRWGRTSSTDCQRAFGSVAQCFAEPFLFAACPANSVSAPRSGPLTSCVCVSACTVRAADLIGLHRVVQKAGFQGRPGTTARSARKSPTACRTALTASSVLSTPPADLVHSSAPTAFA